MEQCPNCKKNLTDSSDALYVQITQVLIGDGKLDTSGEGMVVFTAHDISEMRTSVCCKGCGHQFRTEPFRYAVRMK
jgi:hypothetical protein